MREIEIKAWCDRCWADGERREPSAGQWTMAVISGDVAHPSAKVLDFCESCAKDVAALAELVALSNTLPSKAAKAPEPQHRSPAKFRMVPCPVCRNEVNRSSLVGHVWSQHRTDRRPEMPLTCPDCRETYDSGQGIATHRRLAHGFDAVVDALTGVKGYKVTGREGQL
jgi:uncharacterized protein YbaR (Trm112 family)